MNYVTHSIGGLGAGLAIVKFTGGTETISNAAIITISVLGSLLPDLDHPGSFIGRKIPLISHFAAAAFKHRGFLHTPLFIFLVAVILSAGIGIFGEQSTAAPFIWALISGMLSHIILDSFNKGGIPWAWPYSKKRFRIFSIRTDSITEKAFCICLLMAVGCLFL